jgi:N-acyl-D-amino-acid deacylase
MTDRIVTSASMFIRNLARLFSGLPVTALLLTSLCASPNAPTNAGPQGEMPMTGNEIPGMASFDRIIPALMRKYQIPGGAVAVVKDERLVFARGYGWADRENREPVQPDSLFRIASLSKSLTAATILKLVEEGRLRLDDRAFRLLDDLKPAPGARVDGRIYDITIRQLLNHSGGWDRDTSFDPMFRSQEISRSLGTSGPAGPDAIIRYMLGQPLQFTPGTKYAYSNFGYCVLGRVIERVTGQRYENFVRETMLAPGGIRCMKLGRTLTRERAPNEVRYYGFPGVGLADSVFPNIRGKVPWFYGGWYLEAMQAHGGWTASAVEMARFITDVDGRPRHQNLLNRESIRLMSARPPGLWVGIDNWYGMGWQVRAAGNDFNWWHTGSLDGTTTIMVRAYNGLDWVALFNSRPKDSDAFSSELNNALWQAVGGVTKWPTNDQFAEFRGCR